MHYIIIIGLRGGNNPIRILGRIVEIEIERTRIVAIVGVAANRTTNPCVSAVRVLFNRWGSGNQRFPLAPYSRNSLSTPRPLAGLPQRFTGKRGGNKPIRKPGRIAEIEIERTRNVAIAGAAANQQVSRISILIEIILKW